MGQIPQNESRLLGYFFEGALAPLKRMLGDFPNPYLTPAQYIFIMGSAGV